MVAVAMVALATLALTFALRNSSSGCSYPAPINSDLPAVLRSLGGYDQPLDPSDVKNLDAMSITAATALHPDLIGVSAAAPVRRSGADGGPPQVVVSLMRAGGMAGSVTYEQDCAGRVYFSRIVEFSASSGTVAFSS